MAMLVWRCLHDIAPRYLANLCVQAAFCSFWGHLGAALDLNVYWPVQFCCAWPQKLELTIRSCSVTRTNRFHIPAQAQDPHVPVLVIPSSGSVMAVLASLVLTTNIQTQLKVLKIEIKFVTRTWKLPHLNCTISNEPLLPLVIIWTIHILNLVARQSGYKISKLPPKWLPLGSCDLVKVYI